MATRPELEALTHEHDYLGAAHDENARRTRWVVILTAIMMVGEIVAGYLTASMALLADGFHMATHAGALGVAAIAYSYAKRHVANPRFSFGTGKVGDLAGFASALVLGLIALGIAVESGIRLARPVTVDFADATLVAILGLAVNLASVAILSGGHRHRRGHDHEHDHRHHHHHHHHKHGQDNNMRAAYVHVLADALTSVLAIIALLSGRYLGWYWLDPLMGLVGAVVIARWSWSLMGDTAAVLLDTADQDLVEQVRVAVESAGDAKVADLHVWRIGPNGHAAVVSVAGSAPPQVIHDRLKALGTLAHVTVEVR